MSLRRASIRWRISNQFGWHEGRNPNALFDTAGYLATYTDVAAAGVNPLDHYNLLGWHEGRDPSVGFDTTSYLAAYPDVAGRRRQSAGALPALRRRRGTLDLRGRAVGVKRRPSALPEQVAEEIPDA